MPFALRAQPVSRRYFLRTGFTYPAGSTLSGSMRTTTHFIGVSMVSHWCGSGLHLLAAGAGADQNLHDVPRGGHRLGTGHCPTCRCPRPCSRPRPPASARARRAPPRASARRRCRRAIRTGAIRTLDKRPCGVYGADGSTERRSTIQGGTWIATVTPSITKRRSTACSLVLRMIHRTTTARVLRR